MDGNVCDLRSPVTCMNDMKLKIMEVMKYPDAFERTAHGNFEFNLNFVIFCFFLNFFISKKETLNNKTLRFPKAKLLLKKAIFMFSI